MQIQDLLVSQSALRNPKHLPSMIEYIKDGGYWTIEYLNHYAEKYNLKSPSLISITRFENGILMIHDGHHRVTATVRGGRTKLDESEYKIVDMKLDDYRYPVPENGWITPFDPLTEVRIPDLTDYRELVQKLKNDDRYGQIDPKWIKVLKPLYATQRLVRTVWAYDS